MKQIIDVPEGHTVTITQEGNQLTVETKSIRATHKAPLSTAIDFGNVREGDILMVGEVFMLVAGISNEGHTITCISCNPIMRGFGKFDAKTEAGTPFYSLARYTTEVEKQQLFDTLRDKYALMWNGKELVNWRAKPQQQYHVLDAEGPLALIEAHDDADDRLHKSGNYFPEGFLTDKRIAEFKAVTSKLFASWRR